MRMRTAGLLLLLPALMTNSCTLRKRPVLPLFNASDRTELELKLSEAAWNHARCYFTAEQMYVGDIEGTIATCKRQLLEQLADMPFRFTPTDRHQADEQTKALRDYFKDSYPTAGDALTALRTCCCCQGSVPHLPEFKNMALSQRPDAHQEAFTSQTNLMFNWIVSWVSQSRILEDIY